MSIEVSIPFKFTDAESIELDLAGLKRLFPNASKIEIRSIQIQVVENQNFQPEAELGLDLTFLKERFPTANKIEIRNIQIQVVEDRIVAKVRLGNDEEEREAHENLPGKKWMGQDIVATIKQRHPG